MTTILRGRGTSKTGGIGRPAPKKTKPKSPYSINRAKPEPNRGTVAAPNLPRGPKPTPNVRAEVMPRTYKPTPTPTQPTGGRKKPSAGNPYGSGGGKPAMPSVAKPTTKKPTTKKPTTKRPMFGIKRRGDGANR